MIVTYPSTILREISSDVDNIDSNIIDIIDMMRAAVIDKQALGLAAIQLGINKRIFLTNNNIIRTFLNPKIIELSSSRIQYKEGCLSIPHVYADVERSDKIVVQYIDINGSVRQSEETGLDAIIFQHELDHLNGELFIDHLSRIKREMLLKKYFKAHK